MKMSLEDYRAAILKALLDAKHEDGTPKLTEKEAKLCLADFTDDELEDGILFNSPEEVAELMLEP